MGTNEAHRSVQVRHDLFDLEAWLLAVHDDEGGVARGWPAAIADALVVRLPGAADDLDHRRPIRLRGLEDIHRQGHAVVLGVDEIANVLRLLGMKGDEQ